jgi:hypothetical protein
MPKFPRIAKNSQNGKLKKTAQNAVIPFHAGA